MKFAFLIYLNEAALEEQSGEETQARLEGCFAHFGQLVAEGRGLWAERLLPVETATTVRVRGDEALLSDGPFAETKEQMAGLYVIDCSDEAEALATAAELDRVHGHPSGCIEIRPVLEILAQPDSESSGQASHLPAVDTRRDDG